MKKTTIKDVAREAGVSISTVSKALNNVDVVTPETKQRIKEVAARLHYVPNMMGKQLKSGETKMLGFFTSSVAGPYFYQLVESIAREADKLGYGLNIFVSKNKQTILNSIMGNLVDGVIGFEDLLTTDDLISMTEEGIKAIFIDRDYANKTMGSIVFNSFDAGFEATEYLLGLNHHEILYVGGWDGVYDSEERKRGYKAALEQHHIEVNPDLMITGYFEEESSYNAIRSFDKIHNGAFPTAILAGNDVSAIGIVRGLNSMGIKVPEEVSVMGFDDVDIAKYFNPPLTTYRNPISQQAVQSVNDLIDLIKGAEPGKIHKLSGELVIRKSTRYHR